MEKHLVSFGIGLAAGLFGGLIGLGGGFIMIPLLVGWLKLDQCRAHGTSLAVLIFTGLSGAATYGWHGNVNWPAAIALAAPAVVTAAAGARLADRLPDWKLKRAFGVFLIFCSALLLLRPCFSAIADHLPAHIMLAALLVVGAFTGFLSGLMGVGGGTIMVPAMILLAGFSQHLAQGTALLVMVPAGLVGAWTHWKLGNTRTSLLPGLIVGVLVGVYGGGGIAHLVPETGLRLVFTALLVYTAVRYLRAKPKPVPVGKPETAHK